MDILLRLNEVMYLKAHQGCSVNTSSLSFGGPEGMPEDGVHFG